jgi:hypothetical protein
MTISIQILETPNPNARRYMVDRPVQEESKGRFFRSGDATDEPLVKTLLDIQGTESVMLLPNSITVNKSNSSKWDEVEPATKQAIESYFA